MALNMEQTMLSSAKLLHVDIVEHLPHINCHYSGDNVECVGRNCD